MPKIAFLLTENMLSTSVTLPLEQFRAAQAFSSARTAVAKIENHIPDLEIHFTAEVLGRINTLSGLPLHADTALEALDDVDLIYLPALWRNPRRAVSKAQNVQKWLRAQFERGTLIAGVGTGCCFMAEAGLLDNRPATTHWHYFDHFQKWYPNVDLKRQHFITRSANLYCTGSVNSLAELTINFIQRYFNRDIATLVERHFFHEIRRAFESEKAFEDTGLIHHDETIVQTQIWMKDNLDKQFTLVDLAQRFEMSSRSFSRRFKQATGLSPLSYLQNTRMQTAKELLQSTNLTAGEVMDRVGYSDLNHFAQLFKRVHGATPAEYRTTVRAKLFKVG